LRFRENNIKSTCVRVW